MTYDQELAAKGKMRTSKLELIRLADGQIAHCYREVIVKIPKAAKAPVAKVKHTRAAKTGTKLEQARKIYQEVAATSTRDQIVELFMSKLGMSKAGATTYFYNVKK
jgi:hypothetical protein